MTLKKALITAGVGSTLVVTLLWRTPGEVALQAQNRMDFSVVSAQTGHVALGLALRKLAVSATFMQTAAHPDDETNALFALYTRGKGYRSVDVQTTRGGGGQNEIGPELFQDMAVLRTSELLSAHRIDGAEQFFTRAIDFGYSYDPNEVINKWGRDAIVGDFVRLIRETRPDVVLTMNIQGSGGDRAHEATTVLTREAYAAAADPSRYPEQIREGLRPWQASKLYFRAGFGGRGGRGGGGTAEAVTREDTNGFDQLLGRTYSEIGFDAVSNHKCQGIGGVPALPGGRGRGGFGGGGYVLMDTTIPGEKGKSETSLFDGVDTRLSDIARFAGANPPAALTTALAGIVADAQRAQAAFVDGNDAGTAAPVEAGLTAIRALRAQLPSMGLSDQARYEIDFRLRTKEQDYQDAVLAAHGLEFQAVSDDGLVVDGQPVRLSLVAVNRGASDVTVGDVKVDGFAQGAQCTPETLKQDAIFTCTSQVTVPKDAKLTTPYFTDHYWKTPENHAIDIYDPSVPFGVPFAQTPFRATFHVKAGSVDVSKELPIQYRYVEDVFFGDKRMELNVVPEFSVKVTPTLAVVPMSHEAAVPVSREVFVSVTNSAKGAAQVNVALDLPSGWTAAPASAPLSFTKEDEALTAHFNVTVPAGFKTGDYALRAVVTSPSTGSEKFSDGYQVIEYPHVERRQVIKPAETDVKVLDVKTVPDIKVGYIVGVGDQVPPAIEQLGAQVTLIGSNELAWGDLSKYDLIMTGVRAYERRDDLKAYNQRLIDYARQGGTVIVQYNKFEFNQAQYGPYPAQVANPDSRVTDEHAPVKVLVPNDPVFNFPNKIGPEAWADWVQERGLYFLGRKDPRYVDLVSMTDSFPDNPGEKLGSLVEAKVGSGRWMYLGLGLWRQLPAGTAGAYELLANLLALPKAPATN